MPLPSTMWQSLHQTSPPLAFSSDGDVFPVGHLRVVTLVVTERALDSEEVLHAAHDGEHLALAASLRGHSAVLLLERRRRGLASDRRAVIHQVGASASRRRSLGGWLGWQRRASARKGHDQTRPQGGTHDGADDTPVGSWSRYLATP